jgi:hypothetical protein
MTDHGQGRDFDKDFARALRWACAAGLIDLNGDGSWSLTALGRVGIAEVTLAPATPVHSARVLPFPIERIARGAARQA